jgi:hypothetical protein
MLACRINFLQIRNCTADCAVANDGNRITAKAMKAKAFFMKNPLLNQVIPIA